MSTLTDTMKNEYMKRILRTTGVRPPQQMPRRGTPHYRMPQARGQRRLARARALPRPRDPARGVRDARPTRPTRPTPTRSSRRSPRRAARSSSARSASSARCDLDREWTPNAEKCPTMIKWLESVGARFGKVQLLRMTPNTLRECRWGLHLDNNNQLNPESNGWAVRVWHELTDDASSRLVVRQEEFDKALRGPDPAAAARAGGGRLAVALPRRLPPRDAHALRDDLDVRERSRAGALDRQPAAERRRRGRLAAAAVPRPGGRAQAATGSAGPGRPRRSASRRPPGPARRSRDR